MDKSVEEAKLGIDEDDNPKGAKRKRVSLNCQVCSKKLSSAKALEKHMAEHEAESEEEENPGSGSDLDEEDHDSENEEESENSEDDSQPKKGAKSRGKAKTNASNSSTPQQAKGSAKKKGGNNKVKELYNLKITCLSCDVVVTSSDELMQHLPVDAGKPCSFKCMACGENHSQPADFLSHLMIHL